MTNLLYNVAWIAGLSLVVGAVFGLGAWVVARAKEGWWRALISTAATFNNSVTWDLMIERKQR